MSAGSAAGADAGLLAGIRILDLSEGIAGPLATMMLAEAGADVIKVEAPHGDVFRGMPGFSTWNRSKRSAVLDLREERDRKRLRDALGGVDVLVHGFTPEAERNLGLDPESVLAIAPHLILGVVTAYPNGTEDENRTGGDPLVLARLGLLDEQPGSRPGPVYLRMPMASFGAAYLLAIGVLARLHRRLRNGEGGIVRTSLVQGALTPMTMHWFRATAPSPGLAAAMPKSRPVTLFECGDGNWIHVMKAPDKTPLMEAAFAALGPEGVDAANAGVAAHPLTPNQGANAIAFRQRSSREWLEHLWAHDIPAQGVQDLGYLYDDPQVRTNGYVVAVDDPAAGLVEQAATPLHITPPPRVKGPAPGLGAHTSEVLHELAQAAERRSSRAVAYPQPVPGGRRPPLDGIRVADFGSYVAGPFATMLLADLGADVIKVEAPTGDGMRWNEAAFEGSQRGKRSVCIDLRDRAQRSLVEDLVRSADIAHHNIRMPAARRLGIDGPTMRALNERLVFCHVSSYGPAGDRADWPGYDQLFQALSGWECESAGEGNPPMWLRFGLMDHLAAMASVVATLLALVGRERGGVGQDVSASLLGAAMLSTSHTYRAARGPVVAVPRLNHAQSGIGPTCRLYAVSDGWICVFDCRAEARRRLCDAVGVGSVHDLDERIASMTQLEALASLTAGGVPAEPVRRDQKDPFLSSEANHRCGLVAGYPHPTYGHIEQIGAFWNFGNLPLRLDKASPTIGQHTDEWLAENHVNGELRRPTIANGEI